MNKKPNNSQTPRDVDDTVADDRTMIVIRVIVAGLRSMRRYKMRSGFMMLGSFIGVAALTIVVSVGTGIEQKIKKTVAQLFGASSIVVSSGGNMFAGGPRGDGARLTMEDIEAVVAAVPSIETFDPMQIVDPAPIKYHDASTTVRLLGQSERSEQVWKRGVTSGEFFSSVDVGHMGRVALIGATVQHSLFGSGDPLGAELLVANTPFRVIGLLTPMGTDAHGYDRDNEIVIPISTMMRRVMNVDTVRGFKVLVKPTSSISQTAQAITAILRERHVLSGERANDFTLVTAEDVQKLVAKTQKVLFLFLPLVAAIALLAGGIVAAALMLLAVSERRGEIGLRLAVGAQPRDVALQFLAETALVTGLGGAVGILFGAAVSLAVTSHFGLATQFSWGAASLGLALACGTGLLAGVLPARRAARLPPMVAWR